MSKETLWSLNKPLIRREYDEDETYLDSASFAHFSRAVLNAIKRGGRMGIRDIRTAMGEDFRERWIWDAVGHLQAGGEIAELWGVPTRWEINTQRRVKDVMAYRDSFSLAVRQVDRTRPMSDWGWK